MISKWFSLKSKATEFRKRGFSVRYVENKLGIPRSTLSGWFRNVELSKKQRQKLKMDGRRALIAARKKAVIWHNEQKENRLKIAKIDADKVLSKIEMNDRNIIELSLAMLYLGEGLKARTETGMGNSDPLILNFFISVLKRYYNLPISKIKCELHLRADQDENKMKRFWSRSLDIPIANFTNTSFDKRTIGSITYDYYKGVCVVRCSSVARQRKLIYLSRAFCEKFIIG